MSILRNHKSNMSIIINLNFILIKTNIVISCVLYAMVTCNQPTSNVTKIIQLIYTCNQSDIYMMKINHLFNMCTNVTKVNHFDYTCIIKIG